MTSKLMFLLWGDDLPEALRDCDLHARLAARGVHRLQVNLDDEPVAPALRLQTFDEPVGAVVSVWTEREGEDVVAALSGAARRVEGWRVDERRPLDPPESWDGSRADTLANVAVLRRPEELPREDWLAWWLGPHTEIAMETQATFGYLQNVVVEPVTPDAPPVDAIVEELFPSEALGDVHAFYGSDGDDDELGRRLTRLMESVGRMGADRDLDLVPSSRYLFDLD
ncbi:hypothetical protein H5V45_07330 [Nocardioides sp. KIGAM211]|uniref:EthD domain-containing protein n=1 Tax=Nocardioides luti TaxID=2761101 RepID=A0A7X0RFC0_9ACTN|nr:hypothetical protein [Nocardioides luti]MBB6627130.1 hypothetical protein [Nocardioides luti]